MRYRGAWRGSWPAKRIIGMEHLQLDLENKLQYSILRVTLIFKVSVFQICTSNMFDLSHIPADRRLPEKGSTNKRQSASVAKTTEYLCFDRLAPRNSPKMSLATPRNDVRRLTFSPATNSNTLRNPLPSPYTPFSGRKSGSVPLGIPRVVDSYVDDALPPEPSAEAQRYIDADLVSVLRGTAIDTITASRKMSSVTSTTEKALAYVSQLIAALDTQLDLSDALAHAPSQRPYIRTKLNTINSQLRLERNSWVLLQTLWRYPDIPSDDLSTRRLAPEPSHLDTIQNLPGYLKLQRIVEWLERIADTSLQRSGAPHLKPLDDPAYRWEYTAARDNNGDPLSMDAPCQGAILDEIEQKAEARLSKEVYRLVRAGRLDEAEEICRLVGQPWRAAAIAGGKRGSSLSSSGVKGLARKTWRKAAAAVATSTNGAISPYERALCGVLAGVLEPSLAVAETYEDELWVRTSVILENAAESLLSTGRADVEDGAIVEAFRQCKNPGKGVSDVSTDLLETMRQVQSFIALGDSINADHLKAFLETLSKLSHTGLLLGSESACRFSAQVCLFLKYSGLLSEGDIYPEMFEHFDSAVQSYVQLVYNTDLENERKASNQNMILPARPLVSAIAAHFLAELSDGQRTVETYSELLCAALQADLSHEQAEAERAGVETRDIEERRILCFKKAGQCFTRDMLDAITTAAVDKIWERNMSSTQTGAASPSRLDVSVSAKDEFTPQDELAIRAIEFLLFPEYPSYEEALQRVTCVSRKFFLLGKRQAARNSIAWFPKKALEHISPEEFAKFIHEFDCWSAYFDALKKHSEWNTFQLSKRPRPLPEHVRKAALAPPGHTNYVDQAGAKVELQKHLEELQEYKRICEKYRDAAIESLRSALLFSGGWMHEMDEDFDPDEMADTGDAAQRKLELDAVRKFGIPQLAMLLHHVLDESGLYADAVELANLIAAEDSKLYESFGQGELKAFLAQIADSAVRLADAAVVVDGKVSPYDGTFFEEAI